MFGRKTRELKRIRKELRGIRIAQSSNKPEPSPTKSSATLKNVIIMLIFLSIVVYFRQEPSDKTDTKIETEVSVPTTKTVERTKREINLDIMKGSSLDPVQKLSLANALEGFGTTLKSVEKIGDWNLGERYRIEVGWYTYTVYFNKQKVQSINNLSNELVYGSRPNY